MREKQSEMLLRKELRVVSGSERSHYVMRLDSAFTMDCVTEIQSIFLGQIAVP